MIGEREPVCPRFCALEMDGGAGRVWGGAVNFSALHTCLNYDGLQPWRAADLLALNGGAYRLRFHQCRPLIGMPWQLDPAFGSREPAKMFTVPELHKMFFFFFFYFN